MQHFYQRIKNDLVDSTDNYNTRHSANNNIFIELKFDKISDQALKQCT